jgi:branched-chain amino acid transport system permease protein
MDKIISLIILGVMVGGIYSLIALGFVFIYKSSKILNLAHGQFLMFFAYVTYTLISQAHLPFVAAVIIVLVLSALVGVFVERFTIRPLMGQSILATIIMTFALGFIVEGIVILISKGYYASLPAFLPTGMWKLGAINISHQYLAILVLTLLLFAACMWFYQGSRAGLAMRAVAEDHITTASTGISVAQTFRLSWVIACLLAVISGLLLSSLYDVHIDLAGYGIAKGLPVILLGGLESMGGALVGGLIVGLAEMFGAGYIDPLVGGGFREVVPFILMVLILMVKPYGIFGLVKIERV